MNTTNNHEENKDDYIPYIGQEIKHPYMLCYDTRCLVKEISKEEYETTQKQLEANKHKYNSYELCYNYYMNINEDDTKRQKYPWEEPVWAKRAYEPQLVLKKIN